MSKRVYTHVQELLPEIQIMINNGKTQQEIAEHFGLADKYVVRQLLKRERTKLRKMSKGIFPKAKGRPRKESAEVELERLRMENKLLRDFLQLTEGM